MSLGNDPARISSRQEPEPEECRYCDRGTYDPKRVCPDCRHEGAGAVVGGDVRRVINSAEEGDG